MWPHIEQELAKLLINTPFPGLMGVKEYRDLYKNGRVDEAACKAAANFIVNKTDLKSGIREFGSREAVKVQPWSKPMLRAIDPRSRKNGYWWFDEELVNRWSRNHPPGTPDRKRIILDSMRPMLAVCNDWNNFTDLRIMRMTSPIPVISGQGAHKPIYSADAKTEEYRKLHEENKNVFFIGGYSQFFVPFVNPAWTSDYMFMA